MRNVVGNIVHMCGRETRQNEKPYETRTLPKIKIDLHVVHAKPYNYLSVWFQLYIMQESQTKTQIIGSTDWFRGRGLYRFLRQRIGMPWFDYISTSKSWLVQRIQPQLNNWEYIWISQPPMLTQWSHLCAAMKKM